MASDLNSTQHMLAEDPELIGDFIMETKEHLSTIEMQLLALEQDPTKSDAIHSIFRGFHTIKGLSGFLGLTAIQEVTHEVETVLDLVRTNQIAVTPEIIDCCLETKDYLNKWVVCLSSVQEGGAPVPTDSNADLLVSIRALGRPTEPAAPPEAVPVAPPEAPQAAARVQVQLVVASEPATPGLQELGRAVSPTAGATLVPAPPEARQPSAGPAKAALSRVVESKYIKVDMDKLDYLVDMVGEMVIAQSMVRHDPDLAGGARSRLARNLTQLSRITDSVQKTAMGMRMIPVGQLFQKMVRLVRDLKQKTGKQVELELSGEETELDRGIVEDLSDPILHMIRNAVDHGIETPEQRIKSGKNLVARVSLKATHQAGHILIEISDDGRGLDKERILQKAVSKGLVEPGAKMTENEIHNLIFAPGFSTAETITSVSGRGVGMDVVKKNIQRLRGRVDIHSVLGQGTQFLMKLPLTLAIIDGLIVAVGTERYIIPIFAVREMLRPGPDMISTVQNRAEMALVRGSLLPVIRLEEAFAVTPRSSDPTERLLIVIETAGRRFALLVDELVGKQEVVIKSLGETLRNVPGVAGGAILGDGRVGLILDVEGLFSGSARD